MPPTYASEISQKMIGTDRGNPGNFAMYATTLIAIAVIVTPFTTATIAWLPM